MNLIRYACFFAVLALSCRLCPRATAQARISLVDSTGQHLRTESVVDLEPGDVIDRKLIGLAPRTYEMVLQSLEISDQLASQGQHQQALSQRQRLKADSLNQTLSQELARCRQVGVGKDEKYEKLQKTVTQALKRPRPPLLLDPVFYKGTVAGLIIVGLLHWAIK